MIVGTYTKREISKKYYGLTDTQAVMHKSQPFVVLREATYDEWIEARMKDNSLPLTNDQIERAKTGNFYEISLD